MNLPKPEGLTEIPLPLSPHPIIMTKQDVLTPNLFPKLNSNSSKEPNSSKGFPCSVEGEKLPHKAKRG